MKKLSIILFIFFVFGLYKYFNLNFERNILEKVLGKDKIDFLIKLENESVNLGTPVTSERYVFKIKNKNEINCNLLNGEYNIKRAIDNLDEKYINKNKKFCYKYLLDEERSVFIIIQSDILILKVFSD